MKSTTSFRVFVSICLLALFSGFFESFGFYWDDGALAQNSVSGTRAPVVVELFTSEGCSSCPPADRLLAQLDREQSVPGAEIIALGWHVDYWNRLGWVDRFSSDDYTARQYDYSLAFGTSGVYTPQMVVDGATEFVGSDAGLARRVIARAAQQPKAQVSATLSENAAAKPNEVVVAVQAAPGSVKGAGKADVLLAIVENELGSEVTRGENTGRRLEHRAVVRSLSRLGSFDTRGGQFEKEATVKLDKDWQRPNLRAVVFVQDVNSRRIFGAASIPLPAKY